MKVICTATSSKDFDLSDVKTVLVPNHQYDVEIGDEYLVMGIKVNWDSSCVYYLINVPGHDAAWYPYLLFEIVENNIPNEWDCCCYNSKTDFMEEVRFICGFKELCNPQFYYNLVLGEEEQRIYIKRKIELERYYLIKDS
jgi:hypothetical protein